MRRALREAVHTPAAAAAQGTWSARARCWMRARAWACAARAPARCTLLPAPPRCPTGRPLARPRYSSWSRTVPRRPTGAARGPDSAVRRATECGQPQAAYARGEVACRSVMCRSGPPCHAAVPPRHARHRREARGWPGTTTGAPRCTGRPRAACARRRRRCWRRRAPRGARWRRPAAAAARLAQRPPFCCRRCRRDQLAAGRMWTAGVADADRLRVNCIRVCRGGLAGADIGCCPDVQRGDPRHPGDTTDLPLRDSPRPWGPAAQDKPADAAQHLARSPRSTHAAAVCATHAGVDACAARAQDKQGNTALHLAARAGHAAAVRALLAGAGGAAAAVARRNRAGQLPLHAAAGAGAWAAAAALAAAAPAAAAQPDRRGLTPPQWAIKRGHPVCAALLLGRASHPCTGQQQ